MKNRLAGALKAGLILLALLIAASEAYTAGTFEGSRLGPNRWMSALSQNAATGTVSLSALNASAAFRVVSNTTKDVKGFKLKWPSVSTPGTVQARLETVDATTGKPTGTLYDANATIDITPASGVQIYMFASLPTTGMVAGDAYSLVLITTVAGTTQVLASDAGSAPTTITPMSYPVALLTASDGTNRSNFAEVNGRVPLVSFILEDDSEDALGALPFHTPESYDVYGTRGFAQKFVLTRSAEVMGASADALTKTGTPAGDLRLRIFNSSDTVVSGTTVVVDKDYISTGASSRGLTALFTAPVTLSAGTYRVVWDCGSCADASNSWTFRSASFFSSGSVPSSLRESTTSDVTATPPTWSDSTTAIAAVSLLMYSQASESGAGWSPRGWWMEHYR